MGVTAFVCTSCTFKARSTAAPLEPEAPATPLGPDAPIAMRIVVAVVAGWDTVFLLGFTGLTEATSMSDGHFRLAFSHDADALADSPFLFPDALGHLTGAFPVASTFLFFKASVKASEPGTG
jgi:hypothetical protein